MITATAPSDSDPQPFRLHRGNAPLLVSIPHGGTALPAQLHDAFSDEAHVLQDTDWHLGRLYAFARDLGATVLEATVSRYAIDLNRPPSGASLYPGQTTTGLCPTETFRGVPLYRDGRVPDEAEIARRRHAYWAPYHAALRAELDRLRTLHGQVLLWEAHSIASVLPRLFDGRLPDLNFGTNSGAACAPSVIDAALAVARAEAIEHVHNGRFKGGYITRHYGEPAAGVHAIQLEMCQHLYMDEAPPFEWREERAGAVQPTLRRLLEAAVGSLQAAN